MRDYLRAPGGDHADGMMLLLLTMMGLLSHAPSAAVGPEAAPRQAGRRARCACPGIAQAALRRHQARTTHARWKPDAEEKCRRRRRRRRPRQESSSSSSYLLRRTGQPKHSLTYGNVLLLLHPSDTSIWSIQMSCAGAGLLTTTTGIHI